MVGEFVCVGVCGTPWEPCVDGVIRVGCSVGRTGLPNVGVLLTGFTTEVGIWGVEELMFVCAVELPPKVLGWGAEIGFRDELFDGEGWFTLLWELGKFEVFWLFGGSVEGWVVVPSLFVDGVSVVGFVIVELFEGFKVVVVGVVGFKVVELDTVGFNVDVLVVEGFKVVLLGVVGFKVVVLEVGGLIVLLVVVDGFCPVEATEVGNVGLGGIVEFCEANDIEKLI